MDHDAGKQSAIEFPKMRAISRDKGIAFERYRSGENEPILLWKAVDFGPSGRRSNDRHPQACNQPVKVRQTPRRLGHDVAAGFIDDIPIHPTLVADVKQHRHERVDRTVALHRREQDVGVKKDPHGSRSSPPPPR